MHKNSRAVRDTLKSQSDRAETSSIKHPPFTIYDNQHLKQFISNSLLTSYFVFLEHDIRLNESFLEVNPISAEIVQHLLYVFRYWHLVLL